MLRNIFSRLFRRRKKNEHLGEFKDAELERGELESKTGVELYREIWSGNYARKISEGEKRSSDGSGAATAGYHHLTPLPEPRQNSSLYSMWEVYSGKNTKGWLEDLISLGGFAKKINPDTETEFYFIKEMREGLQKFYKDGYLSIEISKRKEAKDAVEGIFHSLDTLIEATEKKLGQSHSQRAYAYVNA